MIPAELLLLRLLGPPEVTTMPETSAVAVEPTERSMLAELAAAEGDGRRHGKISDTWTGCPYIDIIPGDWHRLALREAWLNGWRLERATQQVIEASEMIGMALERSGPFA